MSSIEEFEEERRTNESFEEFEEEEPTVLRIWRRKKIHRKRRTYGKKEATRREEPTNEGWRRIEEEVEPIKEEDE